jgi:hypothetical protein
MLLKTGKLNPLNVLGFRLLEKTPKHFCSINVDVSCDSQSLKRWIFNNLKSRFTVNSQLVITKENRMMETMKIGFEDPRESTLFMLKCPYLENRRIK